MLIVVCKTFKPEESAAPHVRTFTARTSETEREAALTFIRKRSKIQHYAAYSVFKTGKHPMAHAWMARDIGLPDDAESHIGVRMVEYDQDACVMYCDPLENEKDWEISL